MSDTQIVFVNVRLGTMTRRHVLRDKQWERVKDFLPGKPSDVGIAAKDNCSFVEPVLYRYKTGIPWRDLTERFGNFRVDHTHCSRWSKRAYGSRYLISCLSYPMMNMPCEVLPL